MILSDPHNNAYSEVTGIINIEVRFIPLGEKNSSFTADGKEKPKKKPAADFV